MDWLENLGVLLQWSQGKGQRLAKKRRHRPGSGSRISEPNLETWSIHRYDICIRKLCSDWIHAGYGFLDFDTILIFGFVTSDTPEEISSVRRTSIFWNATSSLLFLPFDSALPGALYFESRQNLKLKCQMEFGYYPADTQKCAFHIRSCKITTLIWRS